MNVPETRYAKTAGGVHIAYQVRGSGPVDLVYMAGFASNFEVDLEDRRVRAFKMGSTSTCFPIRRSRRRSRA